MMRINTTILQKDLADALGVSSSFLNGILSGNRGVSKERALDWEKKTGIKIKTWLYGTKEEIRAALEKKYGTIYGYAPKS